MKQLLESHINRGLWIKDTDFYLLCVQCFEVNTLVPLLLFWPMSLMADSTRIIITCLWLQSQTKLLNEQVIDQAATPKHVAVSACCIT